MRKPIQQQTAQRVQASQQHPINSCSGGWSSDGLNQQAQNGQEVRVQSQQFSREWSDASWCDRSSGGSQSRRGGQSGEADKSTDISVSTLQVVYTEMGVTIKNFGDRHIHNAKGKGICLARHGFQRS